MSSLLDKVKGHIESLNAQESNCIWRGDAMPILRAFVEMAEFIQACAYKPFATDARALFTRINEDHDPTELECPDCHVHFQPSEGWTVNDVCPNCQHELVPVE